jgi:hypothetical protein
VLIVVADNGRIIQRELQSLAHLRPWQRIDLLVEQGVSLALCGGLRRRDRHAMLCRGIEVVDGLVGDAEQTLQSFLCTRPQPQPRTRGGRGQGRCRRQGRRQNP